MGKIYYLHKLAYSSLVIGFVTSGQLILQRKTVLSLKKYRVEAFTIFLQGVYKCRLINVIIVIVL